MPDDAQEALLTIQNSGLYHLLSEGRTYVEVWDDDYTEDGWRFFSVVSVSHDSARKLAYVRVQDGRIQQRTYDASGDDLWIAIQ